jgi:hypothetical protein
MNMMNIKSFPMADVQVVKETKDVKAFELNECDVVAAHTLGEAKTWYMEEYSMDAEEAFYDHKPQEITKDKLVWDDEERTRKISVGEIIDLYWEGKPFVVYSTEV